MATNWRELIVTFDDEGLANLATSASHVIASLSKPKGPRSDIAPAELHDVIWSLDVCPEEGVDLGEVVRELGEVVWSNGVAPSDPASVAHLHPPTLLPSVATELAIAATNQSMDSWDQAPAATEVELHLMAWLAGLAGLAPNASGIMTSGGTASNVLALTLARSWMGSRTGIDVLKTGLPANARDWRILCSDQAHFSVQRAAAQLGLGRDAVVVVTTEASGAMSVSALDDAITHATDHSQTVLAIVATAGTTDLGAIDPLRDIGERARRINAWFHIDAAVAGAFLLSDRLRTRLAGIELADSITIDFHKLWWQPFNASALIVRDAELFDLLRVKSSYLDRGDEVEGMVNLVGRSLDTSRRFDAAKVVAALRVLGRQSLSTMLDRVVDLATYAGEIVESHPALRLLTTPTSVMCVFDVPGLGADELREVQQRLLLRGEMILGRTEIRGHAALKFTFMNPLSTHADVERLVDMVVREIPSTST